MKCLYAIGRSSFSVRCPNGPGSGINGIPFAKKSKDVTMLGAFDGLVCCDHRGSHPPVVFDKVEVTFFTTVLLRHAPNVPHLTVFESS